MRERPILFRDELALAIRGGYKTVTRRLVHPDIVESIECGACVDHRCPYGVAGDALWLREAHYRFGHWEPVRGARTKGGRTKWAFVADSPEVRFDAPREYRSAMHRADPATPAWHKRLGRFMPRAYARTLLRVVDVRAERLQDITEEDARAEGVGFHVGGPVLAFRALWDSLAPPGARWSDNPWVWRVAFARDHLAEAVTQRDAHRRERLDARLGAAVRAAVERMEGEHIAGHYTTVGHPGDVIIGPDQLEVLRAVARALRDESKGA